MRSLLFAIVFPCLASSVGPLPVDTGQLPISFEPNVGQADPNVWFIGRSKGYLSLLTRSGLVLWARGHQPIMRMSFAGAGNTAVAQSEDRLPGSSNYFIGADPSHWHTGIPTFAAVRYSNLYPGISLVLTGRNGRLKYDLIVEPGADPGRILLAFGDGGRLSLSPTGDLVLRTATGEVRQQRPEIYQHDGITQRRIEGRFVLQNREVRFAVGEYDRTRPLIIDPVISYVSFIGGNGNDQGLADQHGAVTVGPHDEIYLTGDTDSVNFPLEGTPPSQYSGGSDAFILKLNASGTAILYSTYLGGGGDDQGNGIAVDALGNAYMAGRSLSTDFPTTPGVFQRQRSNSCCNVIVSKLDPTGAKLLFSTYLGGDVGEEGHGIAVDPQGNVYVTSQTASTTFPTTEGALQRKYGGGTYDVTVTKLDPQATRLVYSTYLGGSGTDNITYSSIALSSKGEAYLAGRTSSPDFPVTPTAPQPQYGGGPFDAWLAKLSADGSKLIYCTFYGGSGDDRALSIATDWQENAYAVGNTSSTGLPAINAFQPTFGGGAQDCFLVGLQPDGARFIYSSYLGGSRLDLCYSVATDSAGYLHVTGPTRSPDFPTVDGSAPVLRGTTDTFVARLNPKAHSLIYSVFLGGRGDTEGWGVVIDSSGNAVVEGSTTSPDFPVTDQAIQPVYGGGAFDAFVAKVTPDDVSACALTGQPTIRAVVNAASFDTRISSNALITITGANFGSGAGVQARPVNGGGVLALPPELGCIAVEVDGKPAPLLFTGTNQINAQAPILGRSSSAAVVVIANPGRRNEIRSVPFPAVTPELSPAWFTIDRYIAARNASRGGVNVTAATPASPGDTIVLYGTGFGLTDPVYQPGEYPGGPAPVRGTVALSIAGTPIASSDLLYVGASRDAPGLYEVDVRLPPALADGDALVILTIDGARTLGQLIPVRR